jgi:hypothetical protein
MGLITLIIEVALSNLIDKQLIVLVIERQFLKLKNKEKSKLIDILYVLYSIERDA